MRHITLFALVISLSVLLPGPFRAAADEESLLHMYLTGPIQRIGDSIINPMVNPPALRINLDLISRLAKTGDIIIENNQAFPQWHAVFGALVPNMNFVHAGMVISGADLLAGASEVKKLDARATAPAVYHMRKRPIGGPAPGGTIDLWERTTTVSPQALYVISPEFIPENKGSNIIAMELRDYLMFPAGTACAKAFKLLRPQGIDAARRLLIRKYLAYHVLKQTGYDNAFRVDERESGIVRDEAGQVQVDFTVSPVRLYCTEIIHRALRFADLPGAKLAVPFETLPTFSVAPPKRDSWWNIPPNKGGSFVVADGFIAYSHYLYSNDPPAPLAVARQRADLIKPIQHEWRKTRDNLTAVLRRLRPPVR